MSLRRITTNRVRRELGWGFQTDTTSSGVDYGDFIVRSNYNMDDVVLLIEASHVVQTQVKAVKTSKAQYTIASSIPWQLQAATASLLNSWWSDISVMVKCSIVSYDVCFQAGLEERSLGIITIPLIMKGDVVITNKWASTFLSSSIDTLWPSFLLQDLLRAFTWRKYLRPFDECRRAHTIQNSSKSTGCSSRTGPFRWVSRGDRWCGEFSASIRSSF